MQYSRDKCMQNEIQPTQNTFESEFGQLPNCFKKGLGGYL